MAARRLTPVMSQGPCRTWIARQEGREMYLLRINTHFDSAHRLVGYGGACERPHGHTWRVQVTVAVEHLNEIGVGVDFHELERIVRGVTERFDHTMLNDLPEFENLNPTAENLARLIYEELGARLPQHCRLEEVEVRESDKFSAVYRAGTT